MGVGRVVGVLDTGSSYGGCSVVGDLAFGYGDSWAGARVWVLGGCVPWRCFGCWLRASSWLCVCCLCL